MRTATQIKLSQRALWRMLAFMLPLALAILFAPVMAHADDATASADGAASQLAAGMGAQAEVDISQPWAAEDFTYGDEEKLLYGCDYSRQFSVAGKVVTGFSEQGEAKLAAGKTDLVVPAQDDQGNTLIGVGKRAFYDKGLTSVTFPTGMLIPYDDTVTHRVTKRGNFIIFDEAFGKNQLTRVDLPTGVLAVMPSAFKANQLEEVSFGRTIWWIENLAFANNQITTVNFPITVDFQLEMHGMPFSDNQIKSVRIPDFTAVVNKFSFAMNPGMEETPDENPRKETLRANGYPLGVVYMYCGDLALFDLDRIHHIDKTTESTHSWYQKLVYVDDSEAVTAWTVDDFTFDGNTVTGLSDSGIAKRAKNKNLVIPDRTPSGRSVLHIAGANNGDGGLFGTADEGFDSVQLPNGLQTIGERAFVNVGLKDIQFPLGLKKIGMAAFQQNQLTGVVLPDTVIELGGGAFASNPLLERIGLSKGLTEIPDGAFGCSDGKHWMPNLTAISIPDTVTKIGNNAFAGNNFSRIEIPSSVKEIGRYAFSTKNYLDSPCELVLNEGLETIGSRAFRNKVIAEVDLPITVTGLPANTFEKKYSTEDLSGTDPNKKTVTTVYVTDYNQYTDKVNFPVGDEYSHVIRYKGADKWVADDFTYGQLTLPTDLHPADDAADKLSGEVYVVTGLTDEGQAKLEGGMTDLAIPAVDDEGNQICGIGDNAFKSKGFTSVTFPEGVKAANDKPAWNASLAQRGNFFIGASAFMGNALTKLTLPEGVLYVGGSAFNNNDLVKVTFPSTLMYVGNQAFAKNDILTVAFPEVTDFPLQLGEMAFGVNKIQALQLPTDISFLGVNTFFQNTGMEPVTGGNASQQKGGIVHLYVTDLSQVGSIALERTVTGGASVVQEFKEGTVPGKFAPWGLQHFTFDEAGTTVTGLTDVGKEKLKLDSALEIPDKNAVGSDIIGIGDGETRRGTFGVVESETEFWLPTSVKLPAKLQVIGKFAFAGRIVGGSAAEQQAGEHYGIRAIELPNTLTTIGVSAFQIAPLSEVVIPDSVTTMGGGAFASADTASARLTKLTLGSGLKDIPASAFATQGLEDIVIPEGVETIGRMAFNGNFSKTLSLPSTLVSIGDQAFMNHQFTEVDIPSGVKNIGKSTFRFFNTYHSATLKNITFHEGLESIGERAFDSSMLDSIEIPTTLVTLDSKAFDGNKNPVTGKAQKVALRTAVQDQVDAAGIYTGIVANGTGHTVTYDKLANTGWDMDDFTYDEEAGAITGWSDAGFAKRPTNHALVLPDATPGGKPITVIGEAAFRSPDGEVSYDDSKYDYNDIWVIKEGKPMPGRWLSSVVFPKDLVEIQKDAFLYNYLTAIPFDTAPNLTTIGETAFKANRLMRLHLPEKVVNLGDGAFAANALVDLKLPNTLTVIPQGCFSMNIRLSKLEIPSSVTEIGAMAFAGARFETLNIPSSVKKIGRKAFHLHHLSELIVPGSVKNIESESFEGTFKAQTLKKLTLKEGIETIGNRAFKEGLLTQVALPYSLKEIQGEPFQNNTGNKGLIKGKDHVVKLTTNNPEHLKFNKVVGVDGKVTTPENHWVVLNQHTITFNANGGKVKTASAKTSATTGKLTSLPTPTRLDFNFLGWYTAKTGGTKVTKNTLFVKNATVYAHWKKVDLLKQMGKDGTPLGTGASMQAAEAAILKATAMEGPAGSKYAPLQLRSTKQANVSITLNWNKASGATKYMVYAAPCTKGAKYKKLTTVTKNTLNVTKVAGKKLAKGTYYRFMVVALNKNNKVVSSSKTAYVATKGGKVGNVGKVTTAAKKNAVSLKVKKTFKLAGKQVAAVKSLKVTNKRKLSYETTNAKVATVSAAGLITAKAKGTCFVYAYAQNGVFVKVKVTVK